ncbi:hypothetical protein CCR75_007534 [Bremia lactucae]|uniref:RxLR effector candidate protein n=1 Tax=Bremia lactucae TaxID=4779 RepID=A0A976ICH4_BRELC|nr:hypothetical protein CCR75_007534 [Bremia lactucae]
MVRVYVTALIAYLALHAAVSATSQTTLAGDSPVDAEETDTPVQRRLRAHAETNLESDERALVNLSEPLFYRAIRFLPLPKPDMAAIINLVKDLELSSSEALNNNLAQLQHLKTLVQRYNWCYYDKPISLFELLEKKYGAAVMEKMMETAKDDTTDMSISKVLYKERQVYLKQFSRLGTKRAMDLQIGKDGMKDLTNEKLEKLARFIADNSPNYHRKEIYLEVLITAYGGEKKLVHCIAQVESPDTSLITLKVDLAMKWMMDKVPLDKVWSYVCKDREYAPTDDEVKMFSHLIGYVFLLSSNDKIAEGSTDIVETKLAQAYHVNLNELAHDMLVSIRLARQYPMSIEYFKLPNPLSFPIQKALFEFMKHCDDYNLHSHGSDKKDSSKLIAQIYRDEIKMDDFLKKSIQHARYSQNKKVLKQLKQIQRAFDAKRFQKASVT